ncbi:MAG: Uma2 family endonuclease [Cyanobacteria bacterium P01_H01_bin.162]
MTRTSTTWSVADYHQMIATGLLAGRQVELLDGDVVEMAPELPIHWATYRRGAKYLEALLGERAIVFTAAPITLPSDGEPQPDIMIAAPPESHYDDLHPGPDDVYWLIEVSNSTLTFDLEEKARLYARDGIVEYWVVDVPNRQLWVHRQPEANAYAEKQSLASGMVAPLAFPDLEIKVERLLPER